MKVAYLCDGKDKCSKETGCMNQGGPCHHTCNIEHAIDFEDMTGECVEAKYMQKEH